MKRNNMKKIILCVIVFLILIPISVFTGYEPISPSKLWMSIKNPNDLNSYMTLEIIMFHRIPRTFVAILVGAGLSIGGVAFQALLRNPLATPYTLGTASFASLGAYIAYLGMDTFLSFASIIPIPFSHIFAFIFAVLEVLLILTLIKMKPKTSATLLLLSGITIGMLANACISILRYWASPDKLVLMERWWFGSTQVLGYRSLIVILVTSIPIFIFLWSYSAALDQYTFDTEIAQSRGVDIPKLQRRLFLAVSILTAVIVAEVGPIGFVGLIVPHITRYFVGASHRLVFPYSAIIGGAFLLLCDIFARRLFNTEIPVGIITVLFGVPAFLYILLGKNFKEWLI